MSLLIREIARFFWKIFIYLKGMASERGRRKIFQLLIHSVKWPNSQGWAKPKTAARSSIWVS